MHQNTIADGQRYASLTFYSSLLMLFDGEISNANLEGQDPANLIVLLPTIVNVILNPKPCRLYGDDADMRHARTLLPKSCRIHGDGTDNRWASCILQAAGGSVVFLLVSFDTAHNILHGGLPSPPCCSSEESSGIFLACFSDAKDQP